MNLPETIYSDFKHAASAMAESLKAPAEMIIQACVKQAIVDSIVNLLIILFLGIITIVGIRYTKINYKNSIGKRDDGPNMIAAMSFGVTVIFAIIFLCFTFEHLTTTITGFINPEYKAITTFIKALK